MTAVIDDLLQCKDLSVILDDRYGKPGKERHALTNLLLKGGRFWAKTNRVYAPDALGVESSSIALSQSFNNFCDIDGVSSVCNQSLQFMTAKAYRKKTFVSYGQYRKVWSLQKGGNVEGLRDCVQQGIKLKILVEDNAQYVYIVPLHLLEVYLERNGFIGYSDYDGYPILLKDFDKNRQYAEQLNRAMSSAAAKQCSRIVFDGQVDYFLSLFVIEEKQLSQRTIDKEGEIKQVLFPCKRAEIWAEISD